MFTLADAATTDARVGLVREVAAAHGRAPELDVLLQQVVLDADPEEAATAASREAAEHGMDWLTARAAARHPVRAVRRHGGGRGRGAGPPGAAVGRAQLEHARPVGTGAGPGRRRSPEPGSG